MKKFATLALCAALASPAFAEGESEIVPLQPTASSQLLGTGLLGFGTTTATLITVGLVTTIVVVASSDSTDD